MNLELTQLQWQQDTAVLSALRTNWNDKLVVTEGRLQLEKGNRQRKSGESITPDPIVVADHLEALIQRTAQECFQSIQQSSSDNPEFYERISDFKRQFKHLYKCLSDLKSIFGYPGCNNENSARRYSQVFKLASDFLEQVKNYKSNLTKPPLNERPVKHIDYDERTKLTSIKRNYPQRVPLAEIVAAAKNALILAQPKPQPLYIKCIKSIMVLPLLASGVLTLGSLSVLKIVLWNPLEWLIRGEVRTIGPFSLILQELRSLEIEMNTHTRAYQRFTTQLLHCPIITEEVAGAFNQLAPQADLLDLERVVLFSEDITELAPFIKEDKRPGAIPLATFLKTIKELCERKNLVLQTLQRVECLYKSSYKYYLQDRSQSIEDFLHNHFHNDSFKDMHKACSTAPFISPKVLQKLLKAASSSSTCRQITLPKSVLEGQPVRNFLKQNSYRLRVEGKKEVTYRRYTMI